KGERGKRADLHGADLRGTNLRGANLKGADLNGANIDYSCWPLWCDGLGVHIDDRQAIQLTYHLLQNVQFSKNTSEELKTALLTDELIAIANKFHRVDECGIIEKAEAEK
ncbi:MAG: pentapeptide repeat-containing protein, partial [Solibacillus sp.]